MKSNKLLLRPENSKRWISTKINLLLKRAVSLSKQNGSPIKLLKTICNRHKKWKEKRGTVCQRRWLSTDNTVHQAAEEVDGGRGPPGCTWGRTDAGRGGRDAA